MSADSAPSNDADESTTELDARDIDGAPFDDILGALEDLGERETLVLVNSFEPEPLYDVFEQRGFEYEPRQVDDDEWRVEIEREG